jgi:excisionase family DNA binding protein
LYGFGLSADRLRLQRLSRPIYLQEPLMEHDKLLTTSEAAEILGVSKAFLERDRWAGAKVPFVRVGSRSVRYRLSDVDRYIAGRIEGRTGISAGA